MNTMELKEIEEIRNRKVEEAKKLYNEINVPSISETFSFIEYINEIKTAEENENEKREKETILIWTRLSNNSNIGLITE